MRRLSTRPVPLAVFLAIDSLIIVFGLLAAFVSADAVALPLNMQAILATRLTLGNILRAALVYLVWSSCMRLLRMYRKSAIAPWSEAIRIAIAVAAASLVLGTTFGQQPYPHQGASPSHIAADFALFCFVALFGLRALVSLVRVTASHRSSTRRNVLIAGTGPQAIRAFKELRTRQYRTHTVIGFVDCDNRSRTPGEMESLYLGPLAHLETIFVEKVVDQVVIALPARSCYTEIEQTLATCSRAGVEAAYPDDLLDFSPRSKARDKSSWPEMIVIGPAADRWRLVVKRFLDIAVAGLGIGLLSPLFLSIAAAIKLSSRGPVFCLEERYGLARSRFQMWKFRTEVSNVQGPPSPFLRRTLLDKLPQLFNVLLGHMSLVGPRPMTINEVSHFSDGWPMRRFSVKPGLTCHWQVDEKSTDQSKSGLELDLQYVDNWSLGLDARILAQAIPAVVRGQQHELASWSR